MSRWAPHAGLGSIGAQFEALLSAGRLDAAAAALDGAADTPALWAARYSLAAARGDAPETVSALADAAARGLLDEGAVESAALVSADAAAVLASGRGGTARAKALPSSEGASPRLRAALLRAKGIAARVEADVGGALHALEDALAAAETSGDPRELLRSKNALGTLYAALGIEGLARTLLVEARELAEVAGETQSLAIAHGQLASLALDEGRVELALVHLTVTAGLARSAGDVHGEARALALLTEAHGARGDAAEARATAAATRTLYAARPTPWTRMSAVLATLSEALDARLAGDEPFAAARLRDIEAHLDDELRSDRVIAARLGGLALVDPTAPEEDRFDRARTMLARSPRPAWVERALTVAALRAKGDVRARLLERTASLMDARALLASRSIAWLRRSDAARARDRARTLGRGLVLAARAALLPLTPFAAFAAGADDLDDALSSARGVIPDDLVTAEDGRIVSCDAAALAARGHAVVAVTAEVVTRGGASMVVVCRPR